MSASYVSKTQSTKNYIHVKMESVTIQQETICKCRMGTRHDGKNSGCQPVLNRAGQVVVGKDHRVNFESKVFSIDFEALNHIK
jgi:predicted metal-binding protein